MVVTVKQEIQAATASIHLSPETYHDARTCAPGWDVYHLEQKWREWMADGGMEPPNNPDKAFLGFCRKWFERKGSPS